MFNHAQWVEMQALLARMTVGVSSPPFSVDERCVNQDGKRADGTFCNAKAEASGWCRACEAEVFPPGWESRRSVAS